MKDFSKVICRSVCWRNKSVFVKQYGIFFILFLNNSHVSLSHLFLNSTFRYFKLRNFCIFVPLGLSIHLTATSIKNPFLFIYKIYLVYFHSSSRQIAFSSFIYLICIYLFTDLCISFCGLSSVLHHSNIQIFGFFMRSKITIIIDDTITHKPTSCHANEHHIMNNICFRA